MKMLYQHKEELMAKPVTVFLMNGFQMSGMITGIYDDGIILKTAFKKNLIAFHAISTIVFDPFNDKK